MTTPLPLPSTDAPQADPGLHLVLIDGSGFIFRAFHALPPMNRADGVPINAVFGFTNMLAKLLREHVGTHIAVIFDAGSVTFRNRLFDGYKAQRPEPPPEIVPQFALVRQATEAFNIPAVELPDWEADDLIAAYARAACAEGVRVTIVSSDKDLMQLIRPGVAMLDPIKNRPIGEAEVMERFGVPPARVVEVQALMGDAIDNVPGVPGIGPKTAGALVAEFGDLEGVLAAAHAMKPSKRRDALIAHAEAARLSRTLVLLRDDAPLPLPLEDLAAREPDAERLADFLHAQGFRSILTRLGLDGAASAAPATAPPLPIAPDRPETEDTPLPFGPYATVLELSALADWIAEAREAGVVAIDTETDSIDPQRATLLGLSIATAPGRAGYVPLRHEDAEGAALPGQLAADAAIAALAPLLTDAGVLKIYHNAKFDIAVMRRAGAPEASPIDDTMLISFAQEAGAHGHGMDELSILHLGHTPISYNEVTGTGRNRIPFARVPARSRHCLCRRECRRDAAAVARAAADAAHPSRAWRSTSRSTGG